MLLLICCLIDLYRETGIRLERHHVVPPARLCNNRLARLINHLALGQNLEAKGGALFKVADASALYRHLEVGVTLLLNVVLGSLLESIDRLDQTLNAIIESPDLLLEVLDLDLG